MHGVSSLKSRMLNLNQISLHVHSRLAGYLQAKIKINSDKSLNHTS